MAFSAGSDLGSNQSKTSGTTLVITTGATVTVGQIIVLLVAFDNISTTDKDGVGSPEVTVSDSAGNSWSIRAMVTNSNGSANAGASLEVFTCVCTTQLSSGGTITCTWGSSITAKAATARSFNSSIGNGIEQVGTIQFAHGDGVDPASMSDDSGNTDPKLWIHGLAYEGDHGDSYTQDSDLTSFTSNGTTGGGAASNMSVRGGYAISSAQTLTVNVATGAARDHTQTIIRLVENPASGGATVGLPLLGVG